MKKGLVSVLSSIVSILVGLLFGFILLMLVNPGQAGTKFVEMMTLGISSGNVDPLAKIAKVLYQAAPLVMTGLAVAFAFKTGLFNIGASGQYTVGAFAALTCAIAFQMPWWICLIAAMIAGAVWGMFPGLFKALFNVNEVITAIMFNWIALFSVNLAFMNMKNAAGKTYGVFTAATAKLQDNRVRIFEEITVPMALKGKTITLQLPVRALHHQWILLHILKFRKFAFSHKSYCVRLMKYLGCTNILSFLIPHIPLKCCSTLSGDDASCVVLRDLPRRALSAIVGTYYMYVRHSGTCPSYPDDPL